MSPLVPRLDSVAQLAEVSRATASKALNGRPDVSPSTRDRVLAAAEQLGYKQPGATQEGARLIGLVGDNLISPYTLDVIRGAATAALQAGVGLITQYTPTAPPTGTPMPLSREWFEQVRRQGWLGVITVTSHLTRQQIADIRELGIHLVAIDPANALPADIASIGATNWNGGVEATQHLIGLGHRRIGVIVGQGCDGPQLLRLEGFKDALAEAGLPFDESCVRYELDSVAGGHQSTLSLIKAERGLTAIFATNDLLAFGAMQALADEGIKVPGDVSIVGVTDIQMAQEMRPGLTTVALNIEEVAKSSINLLLDMIENPEHQPTQVRISDPQLIVRESTGPVRRD